MPMRWSINWQFSFHSIHRLAPMLTTLHCGQAAVCRKFLEFLRLISIPLTYRTTSYGLVTNFRGKFPPTAPPTPLAGAHWHTTGCQMIPKIWTQGKTRTGWPGANWVRIGHNLPGEQVWQMPSFHDKLITHFLPRLVMSYLLLSNTSVQHSASSHLTDDVLSGDGRKFWKFLGAMWHMRWLDSTSGNFWQLEDDDADGDNDGLTLLELFSPLIVFELQPAST